MTEQIEQQKEKPVETVEINLTLKITKPWLPIFQGLSEIVGVPVEAILLDDLYSVLESFFSGEYFMNWIQYAAERRGIDKANTEQLEKMMHQIREKQL